jgi:threonine/homoserine/homoserine lactone efflux protein
MNRRLKLFGWTAAVSFAGSLPLGTLNLTVAHYASQQGALDALYFSIAAITVEAFFTRLAVRTIGQLEKQSHFFRFLDIGTTLLLLLLAGSHLAAAWRMQPFHTALALPHWPPFLSGLVLSAINPLHLPFWMGWAALFRTKNILGHNPPSRTIFILAAGAGTALAFAGYGLAGARLIPFLGARQSLLNGIIGIVLLITAAAQLRKQGKRSQNYHTLPQGK